jgi:hypothetical protein
MTGMPALALLLLAALAPAPGHAGPALSDRIQITEVVGPRDVKVMRAASGREEFLHVGENLFAGDALEVAPRQVVGLLAYDGSRWKLAPGTRFKAEARKSDPATQSYWLLRLERGAMWGQVPKDEARKGGFRLKVRTRQAALGIRGTEYFLEGGESRSEVDVLEGTAWWGRSDAFAPGSYKEVSAGRHAELGASGPISITETKGDRAELMKAYGITADDPSPKKTLGTAQQCLALGKGWKSGDGSAVGECIDKTE